MRTTTILIAATILGYCSCVLAEDAGKQKAAETAPRKVKVIAQEARIMQGEEAIGTVKEGDVLTVLESRGDWTGVSVQREGKELSGWIQTEHVAPAGGDSGAPKEKPQARPQAKPPKVYDVWPFDSKEARHRQEETAATLGVPMEKSFDMGAGVKLEMILIPAGEFLMGGDEEPEKVWRKCHFPTGVAGDWAKQEQPQHKVRITRPFYMGRYEVTQEQWTRVMGENPSYEESLPKDPVENVSWDDCQKFVTTLNGLIRGRGTFSLPTEAEWEYACRAGTATPFCTGETISADKANFCASEPYGNSPKGTWRQRTTPVGSFAPNPFGLYDMHGNVAELCEDWYGAGYYAFSPQDDPRGPKNGEFRVARGGSWFNPGHSLRAASRGPKLNAREDRLNWVGLRLIFSLSENETQ